MFIQGDDDQVKITQKLILDIYHVKREGHLLRTEDIAYTLNNLRSTGQMNLKDVFDHYIPVASKARYVIPKTETQMAYIEAIRTYDIVVGIGPAGTGKTYIAMAMAIHAYMKKQVSRIILARPAVEAGERLGFLPGDMQEKIHPYLRPLYDALYDMMDSDKAAVLMEKGLLEIAPLAYMRGRT
ncbi:PhoH family protein, partial [Candidatus Magnetobacterium bavaricum]